MPIRQNAKIAVRNAEKKAVFNLRRKRKVKSVLKDIEKSLADNKADEAEKKLPEVFKVLDKAAKMNTLKKNAVSRKKSRLAAAINRVRGEEK
jgi:small subunit ribosomal protein S20